MDEKKMTEPKTEPTKEELTEKLALCMRKINDLQAEVGRMHMLNRAYEVYIGNLKIVEDPKSEQSEKQ